MIESMGVHQVDGVKSGECAIQQMQENAYDVFFCVYNLGQGKKDGQQMIEEPNILIFSHIQP
jgi:hypothetical protein